MKTKTSKAKKDGGARARMPMIADPLKLVAAIARGDKAVGVFLGRRVVCPGMTGGVGVVVKAGDQYLLHGQIKCNLIGCKNYGTVDVLPAAGTITYRCKNHRGNPEAAA